MSNQKLIIFFVIFLIIGWFYWFQYRPSQSRATCAKETSEFIKTRPKGTYETMVQLQSSRDFMYENYLNKKGLIK